MVPNINRTFYIWHSLRSLFLIQKSIIPEGHFLCCTPCCVQAPGPGFIYIGYFMLSSYNPPVSPTAMPRNGHRVFPFYNLYMQKIHPSQECSFHPQEESGAIWLIDTTSPEIEKAIWLKGSHGWKLLSQHTAKVLCHMKFILWGQWLESGYSPNIILPANCLTHYDIYFTKSDAQPWLPRVGLEADGRKQPAREIVTFFVYQ